MRQRKKIPVSILGATGVVGQHFVHLLADHPWFEIKALIASERHAGKAYQDCILWPFGEQLPAQIATMEVESTAQLPKTPLVFSALPTELARKIEPELARQGLGVCSNASAFRDDALTPLLIPEINPEHIQLIPEQQRVRHWEGWIVTSPNCTTTAAVMPLKPLHDAFGLKKVLLTSMQALSGAGYHGLSALKMADNVMTQISGEEEKLAAEPLKLLGRLEKQRIQPARIIISAQANRVPVSYGHTVCFSAGFEKPASPEEVQNVLSNYRPLEAVCCLPSAPQRFITLLPGSVSPQPNPHKNRDHGMTAVVGRIRRCPVLDIKGVVVIHNAIRGAAGGAILNAEYLFSQGLLS